MADAREYVFRGEYVYPDGTRESFEEQLEASDRESALAEIEQFRCGRVRVEGKLFSYRTTRHVSTRSASAAQQPAL